MAEASIEEEEITFGDIVQKAKSSINFLLSKWPILLAGGFIGGVVGLLISLVVKPTFEGQLTFVLSTEQKGGSLSGIASQFGFDLGGGGTDVFSGENILTLFRSKKMVKAVLFKKPTAKSDLLINMIVKEWGWDKKWIQSQRVRNYFPFPANENQLTPIHDSLIREVYNAIIEKNLSVDRVDKKLSVYSVTTTSGSDTFSCYLTRFLMDETANFYIETKTSLAKSNLEMLQKEADSLRVLLGGAITSNATEVDRTFNLNSALQRQRSTAQKGQVRAGVLSTAYGEVVKNLEIAKINLQKETPLYQIIDIPEMPLKKLKKSVVWYISITVILSLLTCVVYLLINRKIRNVNASL